MKSTELMDELLIFVRESYKLNTAITFKITHIIDINDCPGFIIEIEEKDISKSRLIVLTDNEFQCIEFIQGEVLISNAVNNSRLLNLNFENGHLELIKRSITRDTLNNAIEKALKKLWGSHRTYKFSVTEISSSNIKNLISKRTLEDINSFEGVLEYIYNWRDIICNYSDETTTLKINSEGFSLNGYDIPIDISKFKNVKRLLIEKKNIRMLPDEISGMELLEEIDIADASNIELPFSLGELKNLRTIKLEKYQGKKIPEEILQICKLQTLIIQGNRLSQVNENIGRLKDLEYLYLFCPALRKFSDTVRGIKKIKVLNLFGCSLSSLPPDLYELEELEELNLGSNRLENFPEVICGLSKISELNLSGNKLTDIPEEIFSLKKLKYLNLKGNPGLDSEKVWEMLSESGRLMEVNLII